MKNNWDMYAPMYNVFMAKDHRAYATINQRIRKIIAGKKVLELATGTGLIAKNVASAADMMIATDYSKKMIMQAKKGTYSRNLRFAVADATDLPYADNSFDVIIISNALHIMPDPDKALAEIDRVLKPNGVLVAPTFIHGNMPITKRMLSKGMSVVGFQTENKWSSNQYKAFLEDHGFAVKNSRVLDASFPLMYVECVRG